MDNKPRKLERNEHFEVYLDNILQLGNVLLVTKGYRKRYGLVDLASDDEKMTILLMKPTENIPPGEWEGNYPYFVIGARLSEAPSEELGTNEESWQAIYRDISSFSEYFPLRVDFRDQKEEPELDDLVRVEPVSIEDNDFQFKFLEGLSPAKGRTEKLEGYLYGGWLYRVRQLHEFLSIVQGYEKPKDPRAYAAISSGGETVKLLMDPGHTPPRIVGVYSTRLRKSWFDKNREKGRDKNKSFNAVHRHILHIFKSFPVSVSVGNDFDEKEFSEIPPVNVNVFSLESLRKLDHKEMVRNGSDKKEKKIK